MNTAFMLVLFVENGKIMGDPHVDAGYKEARKRLFLKGDPIKWI